MPKPNFLIITSDMHSARVSSPYGHPFVKTPAIQRLADRGVVFGHAYCNSPLCLPSRCSFMTGKHVFRIGVWDNGVPLASDEPTWAHRLNALGYETALAGKGPFKGADQRHGFSRRLVEDMVDRWRLTPPDWSLEFTSAPAPTSRETARGIEEAGPGDSSEQQYDDDVVARSVAYLTEPARKKQPWAFCASLMTPHPPLIVRQRYFDLYYPDHADLPAMPAGHLENLHPVSKRLRWYWHLEGVSEAQIARARAVYYGLITFCDERIGMLLDALESNGLTEDTVVLYVSDHGMMYGQHGLWQPGSFYDESMRIPCIMSWPGHIAPGRRLNRVTSLLDVVGTILELAGDDCSDLDGASLVPLLNGKAPEEEGVAIAEFEANGVVAPQRMVRRGRFKLNYYYGESVELFDLASDPDEFEDLAPKPEYASVRQELTEIALRDWDPDEIDRRVRDSQRRRQIIVRGDPGPPTYLKSLSKPKS